MAAHNAPSTTEDASLRSQRARIAAYSLHAQVDGKAHTAPARLAFLQKFVHAVDPHGVLPVAERERRATALRKAHFARLALRSAQARRRRPNGGTA